MPEMDGQEALRQVRALEEARGIVPPHGAKIVMTTALKEIKEVFRSFEALCDAYLVKPIDTAELLGKLRSLGLRNEPRPAPSRSGTSPIRRAPNPGPGAALRGPPPVDKRLRFASSGGGSPIVRPSPVEEIERLVAELRDNVLGIRMMIPPARPGSPDSLRHRDLAPRGIRLRIFSRQPRP